jgi:hypothetical protein
MSRPTYEEALALRDAAKNRMKQGVYRSEARKLHKRVHSLLASMLCETVTLCEAAYHLECSLHEYEEATGEDFPECEPVVDKADLINKLLAEESPEWPKSLPEFKLGKPDQPEDRWWMTHILVRDKYSSIGYVRRDGHPTQYSADLFDIGLVGWYDTPEQAMDAALAEKRKREQASLELPSPNLTPDENGEICCPSCGRLVGERDFGQADVCKACERGLT